MGIKEGIKHLFRDLRREKQALKGEKGKDRIYSSINSYSSIEEAQGALREAKAKLFDVNEWGSIPGLLKASFQLYTNHGEKVNRTKLQLNDYIKITLPGPFPKNWVKVIDVKEGFDFAEFTVSPSEDPTDDSPEVTEHFFQSKATSKFRVERKGFRLEAYEIGRNESANTNGPESGNREMINAVVAEGGWMSFQEIQWKNLTEYLVHLE